MGTGCRLEELPGAMNDRDDWRERVRETRASRGTCWYMYYHPIIPKIYCLPKTHPPDISLRPIIFGIGSAPHNIAKLLAKLLSHLLHIISDRHIKNSGSLLNQQTDIDMNNKYLARFDIKSLFINIPVGKCIDLLHNNLKNLISHFLYLSLNWLKCVPYALHTATSNTTTYLINKKLVYQWDLRLVKLLHAVTWCPPGRGEIRLLLIPPYSNQQ